MSAIKLQRRLLGSANRIHWQAEDWARLARYFNYDGAIGPLLTKRNAPQVLVVPPVVETEKSADGTTPVYKFVISTAATDSMNDQIAVAGWDLSRHRTNPVVLFGHNSDALPVGRAIWTGVEGGQLKSRMVFSSDAFAQQVRRMVDERVLRAASVGFRPGKWEWAKETTRPGGINYTSGHQLLEWSVCNIPANPQCLFERADDARSAAAAIEEAKPLQDPFADAARARLAAMRRRIESERLK